MFSVAVKYQIQQPLSQFFASQLINLEWVQPGSGEHRVFLAHSDVEDGAGHALVTAYVLKRPDGQWSVMLVNRDQENGHSIHFAFESVDQQLSFAGPIEVATWAASSITGVVPR